MQVRCRGLGFSFELSHMLRCRRPKRYVEMSYFEKESSFADAGGVSGVR
jgi:hypothetical protein